MLARICDAIVGGGVRRRPRPGGRAHRPGVHLDRGGQPALPARVRQNARMLEVVEQAAPADPYFRDLVDGCGRCSSTGRPATLARFQADGLADPTLDPDLAGPALVGMVESFARRWHAHGETYDSERSSHLTRLLDAGCGLPAQTTRRAHGATTAEGVGREVHRGARPAPRRGPAGRRATRSTRTSTSGRRPATFPAHELFPRLGALGLLGLEYDPAYGGQGADHCLHRGARRGARPVPTAAASPMAIGVQTDMATPSLARFGSEELKERYLAPGDPRRAGLPRSR